MKIEINIYWPFKMCFFLLFWLAMLATNKEKEEETQKRGKYLEIGFQQLFALSIQQERVKEIEEKWREEKRREEKRERIDKKKIK